MGIPGAFRSATSNARMFTASTTTGDGSCLARMMAESVGAYDDTT
jgi:hypothetical protein